MKPTEGARKQFLFKYLDINGAASMLHNSNIQYTNATKFNDPFDCHPGLIDFSKVPPERCKGWSPKDIMLIESDPYRRYRERAWICCLSKVFDSMLMWSYYNQHKGVCIGLDMEKVRTYFHVGLGMMFGLCYEVFYRDIIEKPDYFADEEYFFEYQIKTKAKDWAHEQEVRMCILDPSAMIMSIPHGYKPVNKKEAIDWKELRAYPKIGSECFTSIYLAVNIEEKYKEWIIKLGRKLNPNIEIYQMTENGNVLPMLYL
ncbi:DUF2971 domain-containing protein [uncultured Alistipes sp.]|uniref:DUF2971 domain-containing protein n=1 Tax=uncultured Alistipes sp. TaxID=538949 RepID=UPI0025E38C99|nr:DUF2971 domain-containing protein [uncultured Alistipes sp.]